jgi:hypothetical protein
MRVRIFSIAEDGTETPLGTFSDIDVLADALDADLLAAALRALVVEGEVLASLDGRTVLLRRVHES